MVTFKSIPLAFQQVMALLILFYDASAVLYVQNEAINTVMNMKTTKYAGTCMPALAVLHNYHRDLETIILRDPPAKTLMVKQVKVEIIIILEYMKSWYVRGEWREERKRRDTLGAPLSSLIPEGQKRKKRRKKTKRRWRKGCSRHILSALG